LFKKWIHLPKAAKDKMARFKKVLMIAVEETKGRLVTERDPSGFIKVKARG